jgi:metal-sulfur cluster biosynthetic enzyme
MEAIKTLEERVVDVLKTCFDPEIPVNIYDLGSFMKSRLMRAMMLKLK